MFRQHHLVWTISAILMTCIMLTLLNYTQHDKWCISGSYQLVLRMLLVIQFILSVIRRIFVRQDGDLEKYKSTTKYSHSSPGQHLEISPGSTMQLKALALALVSAVLVTAAPSLPRSNHVLHERRSMEPTAWSRSSRLEGHKVLPMRFGLAQQNLHKLEELLMSVSHPESLSYGKHFSANDVVDTFAPSDDTIATVMTWLTDFGIHPDRLRLTPSKGWIEVNATVEEVEDLIQAEYHVYTHPSGAEQIGEFR